METPIIDKPRVIVLTLERTDPLRVAIDEAAARAGVSAPKFILNELARIVQPTRINKGVAA